MNLARLLSIAVIACTLPAAASHWNGGRVPPVHKLAPLDAEGDKVNPAAPLPAPISQSKTCGQCHDVASIHGGSHFRTGLDTNDAPASVCVEPWFLADESAATAIPLSLASRPGAFRPADLGLSCWQWTKLFGRSFPGGGVASDPRALAEPAGDRQRWFVTGPLEPNCLACHQQSAYDSSEWARQVLRENFASAATAASGFATAGGMNERMDSSWDKSRAENPDDHLFKVPENVSYDSRLFDSKNRCTFNVGKPRSENCLSCHSVSQKDMPSHAIAGDVHLKRGMACTDCHKNGMDHRMSVVGCAECHAGPGGAGPMPEHKGIPLVHFQKLSCTVCHSGVTAGGELAQVRTSRANRIGIYGRAQWASDAPHILEPVFVRNSRGVIEPRRMMWPSFFAPLPATNSAALSPLRPEAVKSLKSIASAKQFDKATLAAALAELKTSTSKDHLFIGHGKAWTLDGTNLVASSHAAAEPVSWPVGHDVRPARQARGAAPAKCADCHTSDAPFFNRPIVPAGPVADASVDPVPQSEFLGVSQSYYSVLGATFAMRPFFKVFLWTAFVIACLFAVMVGTLALAKIVKLVNSKTADFAWGFAKWVVDAGLVLCLIYLAASGIIGWICGAMTSWWLVLHMVAGGGFTACAILALLFRSEKRTAKPVPALLWLLWTVLAAGVIFTAAMPMMTVAGSESQHFLLWSHRCIALSFTATSLLICRLWAKRKG